MGILPPKVEFFPSAEPNQIITYIEYPEGTSIFKTNKITKEIENQIFTIINSDKYKNKNFNFMIEDAVAQVGEGAGNTESDSGPSNEMPHKAKIVLSMREFKFREGLSSEKLRSEIQKNLKN
mgnify:FL=1